MRETESQRLLEFRLTRSHTIIVLVSVVDRRLVPTLRFVSRLACSDTAALHISVDPDETRRLAADWMNLGLSWLPLHIRDAGTGGVTASVRDAVRQEVAGKETVTVVVPELDSPRWWFRSSTAASLAASPPRCRASMG